MVDILSVLTGAAGVGLSYFGYRGAAKVVPAALAWVRTRWGAGKALVATLEGDVAELGTRLAMVEGELEHLRSQLPGFQEPEASPSLTASQEPPTSVPPPPAETPVRVA